MTVAECKFPVADQDTAGSRARALILDIEDDDFPDRPDPSARSLRITAQDRTRIKEIIVEAHSRPVRWVYTFQGGIEAAYEVDVDPGGLSRHLTVSGPSGEKVVRPAIVETIAQAFGFRAFPPANGRVWTEESTPGRFATNVIETVGLP